MALLDDLVAQVADTALRQQLAAALTDLKRRQRFGLVFEERIPETTALPGLPVQVGSLVQRRSDLAASVLSRVVELGSDGKATLEAVDGEPTKQLAVTDLLTVKRFGEPIYPALRHLGAIHRGSTDKLHHAVINGENYHLLQLLIYLYEGQIDCIYLDPPYNTGALDWKYNNRYVDAADAWRHSKWLSIMEKRLALTKRLLKPDSEELARGDIAFWLRNPDRKPWSLCIPYQLGGELRPLYPDFLFVRRVGDGLVIDLLDPHALDLADAPAKAAGLALYAAKHAHEYGRIELIIVDGDEIRRLNLADERVRDRVRGVADRAHLRQLLASSPIGEPLP